MFWIFKLCSNLKNKMIVKGSILFCALFLFLLSVTVDSAGNSKDYNVPDFKDTKREEILKWESPEDIKKDYPYYLSGFDEEDSPIWVAELGRWDTRRSADGTPQQVRDYKRHIIQMFARCVQSVKLRSTKENPVTEFNLIFDMDGFDVRQSGSGPAIQMFLWIARQAEQALTENLKFAMIVNANYIFTAVFDLMKPILGRALYKVEVFGTNKDIWAPKVLKKFPKEQLPEWYGGDSDHKPIAVYG